MVEKQRSEGYSLEFDRVCKKNSYSKLELERMFGRRAHLPGCRRLNIEELPLEDDSPDLYKRLVMQLKRYNDALLRKDKPVLPTEQTAYEFVYESLRAIAFESKEVQRLNLETLENWFVGVVNPKGKDVGPCQQISKASRQDDEPVTSMQTKMRIKEYSRRHLEVHTGLLRLNKAKDNEDKQNEIFERSLMRTSNRHYMNELKKFRERRELDEIQKSSKLFYQHKQRLSQNLINGRDYVKPDKNARNEELWSFSKQECVDKKPQPEEESECQFEVLEIKPTHQLEEDKLSLGRVSTAADLTRKHKFTLVGEEDTRARQMKGTTAMSRIRTAQPGRLQRELSKSRELRTRQIERHLSQTQHIKDRIHHSLTKSSLTNQMLFQGINETEYQNKQDVLPEQGFALMINPFFDQKRKQGNRRPN